MAKISLTGLIGALLCCAPAFAQQAPDAGALRQQLDPGRAPALPKVSPDLREPGAAPGPAKADVSVVVSEFRFAGNTRFEASQLQGLLTGYLGRPLSFADLQAAAALVARHYREQGWIVRAYLPRQDVSQGIVTIQVVEAIFGRPEFEGSRPRGIALEWVRDRLEKHLPSGQPINLEQVDRSLLLIDDLPGVRVSGRLQPGSGERETNVVLSLEDDPAYDAVVGADNAGTRATGEYQLSGNLNLNSPFARGELVQARLIAAEGIGIVGLAYQQPVALSEWRAGASMTHLAYRLVGEDFSSLDAKGTWTSVGINAMYPLIRSRPRNLFFDVALQQGRFDNEIGGTTTSNYRIESLAASLYGNLLDDYLYGGSSQAWLTATWGRVDLSGSPNEGDDAITTRTAGQFSKLRFAVQKEQSLSTSRQLLLALSGQFASKNLDSSERFFLGGSTGVRAYPAAEGAGANGLLATAELRWQLPERFTASGFIDWGSVTVNRDNDFAGAARNNHYALSGIGASLGWEGPHRLTAKLTWAHRLGDNPNAGNSGNDQDGSLVKHRFWINVQYPF